MKFQIIAIIIARGSLLPLFLPMPVWTHSYSI